MLIGLISFVLCASAMVLSNYLYSDLALTFMQDKGFLEGSVSGNLSDNQMDRVHMGGPGERPGGEGSEESGVSQTDNANSGFAPGTQMENGEVVLNGIIMGDGVFDPSEFEDRGARARMAFDIRRNLVFDFKLLTLLAMIAFLVSHLANLYAQKRIAEPINKIASAMNSFAFGLDNEREENEKKIHELNIRTGDEIELLYKAVDKTVSEVTDYLRRFKEEQRLENELKVAKAASEAKSGFLSNMSHEIRTPINAVLGMDEMILRECKDPQILEYAHDLRDAGKTLLGLVNDILDFSKIEAGKLEILPVEYDLSSVINDLVNMNMVRMETKGLEFNVHVDEKIPHILYGDEIRIKQVVLNILSNAAKYTEKGSVDFSVKLDHREQDKVWLHFDVRDTGIGIKEEDIDKLFKPFERIEEKRNRTIEGTGLGMNIVTQLLTLMDSSLKVKSVYGEGSDFSFTL
ncbi:MAG: hypothetical protein K6F99_02335, partial [Lachnospiraceae bacterium]|nr:hypothetical protein [Lachnospiraceae bacterium]